MGAHLCPPLMGIHPLPSVCPSQRFGVEGDDNPQTRFS